MMDGGDTRQGDVLTENMVDTEDNRASERPGLEWDTMPAENADNIDAVVDAFLELGGMAGGKNADPLTIPKATEKFPFGAKERPVRKKLNLIDPMKKLMLNKASWTNAGPLLVLALLIFSMVFVLAERPYSMTLNGEFIAYIQKTETGQKLLEQASLELSAAYPVEANFRHTAEIGYTRDGVQIKTKTSDEQMILDKLKSDITWLIDGWTISVNNEHTVFLASQSLALAVLDDVKRSYIPSGDELTILNMEFVEAVELRMEEIPVGLLGSPDQAYRTLTEGREPIREYTVQSGDSYWSIATKNNMTVDYLKQINGAVDDRLGIGQVLKLNTPKPLLSVRTMISAIREEDIPFETVHRSNNQVLQGESNVVSDGAVGTMEVEYEIYQINGIVVAQRVLSQTVVVDPVDKVVENGTRVIVASRSDTSEAKRGSLAWPVRGRINSPFGPRSRGNHSGIDIDAKTGDPVYSAGAGKVISASNFAGYGNQVTIDHGGGLTTMYAHLSEINVEVGQEVGVQELVGLAGTTGVTTGPHLHFEVRINGSPVNPMNYLN